jgi:hypothetical protein
MSFKRNALLVLVMSCLLILSSDAFAGRRVRTVQPDTGKEETSKKKSAKEDKDLKPFNELVKDMVKIEGLFTFYHDTTDNSWLMAVTPEQFGPIYMCGLTRSAADGSYYDPGAMSAEFPFFFTRLGKTISMMEKNIRFRADEDSPMNRAIKAGISDHLYGSTDIKSTEEDSTGAVLIDPTGFFVRDAQNISYFLGRMAKTGMSFDAKNSYLMTVKSFPLNTEIDAKLHYNSSQPLEGITMQDPYSMFHTFHFSLSALQNSEGFVPRLADDRIGHFEAIYQDYTNMDEWTPYVRYISRWNLQKKDPDADLSEPVEPIVYWVENTTPVEFRDAIAKGIEFWNTSFEKIGYKNAIVAKIMPDTADWDPADVRYHTVRWILSPGGGYAVGPSRINPFTGEIYDADIRVSSDFIRYMFNNMEYFITPVSPTALGDDFMEEAPAHAIEDGRSHRFCNYAMESAKDAAFGMAYIHSSDDMADKDELTKRYVNEYITELVAHEVGHTLGFRHNYRASTIYNLDEINDPDFTGKNGTVATVMEYAPVNIAGPGKEQGNFYSPIPGPYDDWIIEYSYSDFGGTTPEEDWDNGLKEVANRAGKNYCVYDTDEDAFGTSIKAIDPYVNIFDLGDDPLAYSEHSIMLTRDLWKNAVDKFENKGDGFQSVMRAFSTGWRSYSYAVVYATKFVGGIHHSRLHPGDRDGAIPFKPVSAAEQRRAMKFLNDFIFAADAFDVPANLWNRLEPARFWDFEASIYLSPQVDYPIHAKVLSYQANALARLLSPYVLERLLNNTQRTAAGEDQYTMVDLFNDLRGSIWTEIDGPQNVNSFRRQLQITHLRYLIQIYLNESSMFPYDSRALAAGDLDRLERNAKAAVNAGNLNAMTSAHFREVLRQIESAKGAKRSYSRMGQ